MVLRKVYGTISQWHRLPNSNTVLQELVLDKFYMQRQLCLKLMLGCILVNCSNMLYIFRVF